jgi:hypothetical protein
MAMIDDVHAYVMQGNILTGDILHSRFRGCVLSSVVRDLQRGAVGRPAINMRFGWCPNITRNGKHKIWRKV